MDLVELEKVGKNYQRHPWEIVRAQVAIEKIKQLNLKKGTVVLDVGCGDTFFLKELNKHFPDNYFVGIDIEFTEDIIKELSADLPANIQLINSITRLQTNGREVELVLLMDVIEHVPDDKALLTNIINALSSIQNSGYYILITVPAFQYLFSNHDIFLKHYRRYTLPMLKKLASSLNLKIIKVGYFFTSLFIARNIISLLEKLKIIRPQTQGVSAYTGGHLKTLLYVNFLKIDFHVCNFFDITGIKIPGLSAFMICRKH